MKHSLKLLLCSMLAGAGMAQAAQVSDVTYMLRYDALSARYQVLMLLQTGDIMPGIRQTASSSQVTLIVPANSKVDMAGIVSNEPRIGTMQNGTIKRTAGANSWTNTQKTPGANAPAALAGSDVYSFNTSPSRSFYPAATQGDTVLLFSLSITTPNGADKAGIRLWNNNVIKGTAVTGGKPDPASADFADGLQYNNGMGIGSPVQIYSGNQAASGAALSVNNTTPVAEIAITPNPTTALVNISGLVARDELNVLDMLGNVVATTVATGSMTSMNLGNFASGVYSLFITRNGNLMKAGKIVKQ